MQNENLTEVRLPDLPQPASWDLDPEQRHAVTEKWLNIRDEQLLSAMTSLSAAQGEAERYLTQAYAAEGNAVYQQRRAEKAEAEVARLREQPSYAAFADGYEQAVEDHSVIENSLLSSQLAPKEVK